MFPANITLACATRMQSRTAIVTGATAAAGPSAPKPSLRTCGIGAIRSIRSIGTSASTELVPKMNMTAMIGAAIATDPAMVRAGLRHSPAWIATYSNPPSAPKPIFAAMLSVRIETTGTAVASGWNSRSVPCARFSHGSAISIANVVSISAPPALWTHLPRLSPRTVTSTSAVTIAALTAVTNQGFDVSHSPSAPST